jgi:hypothetical protein
VASSLSAWLLAAAVVATAGCGGPTPDPGPPPDSAPAPGPGPTPDAAPPPTTPDAPPGPDLSPTPTPDAGSPPSPADGRPDLASPSPDTSTPADATVARDTTAPPVTGTVKIMVLGSSNELGTCWRAYLWQKLRAQGVTSFDFVGAMNAGPDCAVPGYDKDTESRNGNRITDLSAAQWTAMFRASAPDVVISHVGGADLLANIANPRIVQAHALAVTQARGVNPRVRFFVGQHTPMEPSSCANCRARVMALNAGLAEMAMMTTTAESPVAAVDLFTGIDVAADTSDRVHLTNTGSQKVADRWLAALLPLFRP